MKKTNGEQLSLRFEASKLGDEVSCALEVEATQRSATVLSLSTFRRDAGMTIDRSASTTDERALLEKALRRVRLF